MGFGPSRTPIRAKPGQNANTGLGPIRTKEDIMANVIILRAAAV